MAREQRRLAAIVAADVVGYSRLMGRDEEGTLTRLKECRHTLIDPKIAEHRGRIVKTTGDGLLVEFASVLDAVRCAVEVQREMSQHNADAAPDQRLDFRIGIHIGDIIIDGDDIFGDGVNIAARMEGIAEPGGIAISRPVHDQVRDRLDIGFADKGEIELKNIARPVQVFAVTGAKAGPVAGSDSRLTLALPDKPSIAVLPFQNMSGDPEQEYFADGMVEDIITALSRTKSLFVIARNSSFAYKGKSPDIRQVGRELGVRYVLEGSVRKSGARVRITGQLIEASSGAHIWADRIESGFEDVFDLQDRITSSVVGAILPTLERAEIERSRRKPTKDLLAYDYYLRGMSRIYGFSREANDEALALFQKAINLDPEFALAHAQAAYCYVQRRAFGWEKGNSQEVIGAERLARRALELDGNDPTVLAHAGWALAYMVGRIEEAAALIVRSVELDPNLAVGWSWGGYAVIWDASRHPGKRTLHPERNAIEYFERALRLSPLDPRSFIAQNGIGHAHFLAGRCDEASLWAETALRQHPNYLGALRVLMASHGLAGRLPEARQAWMLYRQLDPTARMSTIGDRGLLGRADEEKYEKGLRLAGFPE